MAITLAVVAFVAVPAARAATPSTEEALSERVLGKADAPVTILDYSSLTCPHCAVFHTQTLPLLKEKYVDTGKVKIVFRDFPFDQWALRASMMARCAPQERYWAILDILFKQQAQWSRAADPAKALEQVGKLAGMGPDTIAACWADQKLADGILNMRLDGQNAHKVEATPTFVLNDGKGRVEGAQSIDAFSAAIDKLLK